MGDASKVIKCRAFRWEGVELKPYKASDAAPFKDVTRQNVLSEGIDTAAFATGAKSSATATAVSMQTSVVLGPGLKQDDLKKQIAGFI